MNIPSLLLAAGTAPVLGSALAGPSSPDDFGMAAVTCLQATQDAGVDEAVIEANGWTRGKPNPEVAELINIFERDDTRIGIIVRKREMQCIVIWDAKSSDGPDALTDAVLTAVSSQASKAFGGRAKATRPRTEGSVTRINYQADNALGSITAEPLGEPVLFQFAAVNKNLIDPQAGATN